MVIFTLELVANHSVDGSPSGSKAIRVPQSETLTFLFTDLVASTAFLQQVGDEAAQHTFGLVHKMMSDAVSSGGGEELEWLGDGMLAAFSSSAAAVQCAISIQQASYRPVSGKRLQIRAGVHAGEVLKREGGYFGTPLVLARRLCDKAEGGQILCSKLIADFLAARQSLRFHELGAFALKGISQPVDICEVIFERKNPSSLINRTPFVGRVSQLDKLVEKLGGASAGKGAIAMLTGEAGIGKTRLLEEFSEIARANGAQVLQGSCYEGEWYPPYSPFAEALTNYAQSVDRKELERVVGPSAPLLVRIAPGLRSLLPDVSDPPAFDKDEERSRMLDAIGRFFIEISRDRPLVLILDDLHWADRGTSAILHHLSRVVGDAGILLIGAYRDSEIDRRHPLASAIAAISRLPNFERLKLDGLTSAELSELLETIGDERAPDKAVAAIANETDGNPFFIRELLLHLKESGKILSEGTGWRALASSTEGGIPESVRALVEGRLVRLSDETNRFLQVAGAFKGAFSFSIAAAVAGMDEEAALNAAEEAMGASILRSAGSDENLEFTHAIIRNTLYSQLNPLRRTRTHQKIAEAMEAAWSERATEHAAEVAYHFWRAGKASGATRGVEYAIAAADNAELAYAYDETVSFLRIALELLAADDPRRARILARLGLAMIWTLEREEAAKIAREAGEIIARLEGAAAAADYFESAAFAMHSAGLTSAAWELAGSGLLHIGDRRDIVWASLRELDLLREEAADPSNPGMRSDTTNQRQLREVLKSLPRERIRQRQLPPAYESRSELIEDPDAYPIALLFLAGDCRRSLPLFQRIAADAERQGRIAKAARTWADVAVCHVGLGEFPAAQAACDRALVLSIRAKAMSPDFANIDLAGARHDLRIALDEGWDAAFEDGTSDLFFQPKPENNWAFAMTCSNGAYLSVRTDRADLAMQLVGSLRNALERGAPWEATYNAVACDVAATLWYANQQDSIELIERNIRDKVLIPDFRWPMRDSRLALARLCALRGAYDEAVEWFAKARAVLDEMGARPLRAITDYDEALMYLRRGEPGDERAGAALLGQAINQFKLLRMTGWLRGASKLLGADQPHSAA